MIPQPADHKSDGVAVGCGRTTLDGFAQSRLTDWATIAFRLDNRSGLSTYLQLALQVRQAISLGRLHAGDQLPSVREVVARLAINPNTVLKAYRELEAEGVVASRPGTGTFVSPDLASVALAADSGLRRDLARWVAGARSAGLDNDDMRALLEDLLHETIATSAEAVSR